MRGRGAGRARRRRRAVSVDLEGTWGQRGRRPRQEETSGVPRLLPPGRPAARTGELGSGGAARSRGACERGVVVRQTLTQAGCDLKGLNLRARQSLGAPIRNPSSYLLL